MNKLIVLLCLSIISLFVNTSIGQNIKEVKIGDKVWMAENLNVDHFRNGDLIPEAKSNEEWKAYSDAGEAAWCYYENDFKNGKKFGRLYNWFAVNDWRGLAPEGWHIPSFNEWIKLRYFLGENEKANIKMKSNVGWDENKNGTNSSGFGGLPGGFRERFGDGFHFWALGTYANFWTSSEGIVDINGLPVEGTPDQIYYRFAANFPLLLEGFSGDLNIRSPKVDGLSVRCIKD